MDSTSLRQNTYELNAYLMTQQHRLATKNIDTTWSSHGCSVAARWEPSDVKLHPLHSIVSAWASRATTELVISPLQADLKRCCINNMRLINVIPERCHTRILSSSNWCTKWRCKLFLSKYHTYSSKLYPHWLNEARPISYHSNHALAYRLLECNE